MKRWISIIILSVLLLLSIGFSIFTILIRKSNETKLTKANDEKLIELKYELEDREKEIKRLKDNPTIKIEEKVVIQEKIIEKDTEIISDLKFRLDETNTKLKKVYHPTHGIGFFVLAGLDNSLDIDIYIGVTYRRYWLNGRIFLGAGGAVKPYKNIGGSLLLEAGFTF
jgi:hypothetical protein